MCSTPAKVKGNLTVRRAKDGETLLALDGRTYTLDPGICVIADEHGVELLAGIMGGEASGCDENTTDVLIELALWNEINIAQTGRKLGINSDARYRFERGVDPAFMVPGLELATKLVMEMCGGTPSENVVVGNAFGDDRVIDFPLAEVKRLAGIDVPLAEARRILTHLGFMVAGSGPVVKVAVPSWRTDVHGKADIVEEIVRIVGVDKVPMTPFDRGDAPRKPVLTTIQLRTRRAKRALAARGMVEAVTWSFISKPQPNYSAADRPRSRSPIRLPPTCRTCGRACCRASSPPRRPMPIAATPMSRCSKSDRCSRATSPRTSSSRRPACATALRPQRAWDGTGPVRP